jgi:branched-chain amino acid transport system substrate-binding protein
MTSVRRIALLAVALVLALSTGCGRDDEGGDGGATSPGISDSEIKLGGSYPFSGPASAYAAIASGAKARFAAENAKGGIDGRKITFTTLDDGYEPQRAVTNARRLIERDQVFALFNTLGTPNNLAIWDYVNQKKVPHLYVATGASNWGADIDKHPYTIGWQPDYVSEAKGYGEFLKQEKPNAKVAILYQNDGFGKDLLGGFEKAIEGSDIKIVARESYEVTDPTITSQMRKLGASGGDTFLNITTPKFSAQSIAAIAKGDWKPLHILNNVGASKNLVLKPVGLENAKGIYSTTYFKDPEDPRWDSDAAMREYKAAVKKYQPKANPDEAFVTYGWGAASTMVEALKAMKEPNRESLMEAVRNMDVEIPILLPGIRVKTGEGDGYPIQANQIMRFSGENWVLQGEVIDARES